MIIQSSSAFALSAASAYAASSRQVFAAPAANAANTADSVQISQAAREVFAASSATTATGNDTSVEARLNEIRARGPVNRSEADHDFLFANDKRLAEISAQGKSPDQLTAEEIDYVQKATGLVNTMANLSPAEKELYNKAVASGNSEAAAGISQIALTRMMGHTAGGNNETIYDPLNTEITAANIENYFSHSIVDSTGHAQSKFLALIQFLQTNS